MLKTLSLRGSCLLGAALLMLSTAEAQRTSQQIESHRKAILADPRVSLVQFEAERQTPSLIRMQEGKSVLPAESARQALEQLLQLRPGIDYLVLEKQVKLPGNLEVAEYQQFYKGIKVDRSRYKAFIREGRVLFFAGSWYAVPSSLPLQAKLQKTAALERAKGNFNAKKYAWEAAEELIRAEKNANRKRQLESELAEYQPGGELVVVEHFRKEGIAEMRLAFKFNIYAIDPMRRAWVYIDAENGETLLRDEIIKHADEIGKRQPAPTSTSVTTTVTTRYAGNRVIKTKQISGNDPNSGLPLLASNPTEIYLPGTATFGLIDDSRGSGIETYDLNGVGGLPVSIGPAYSQGKSFTDANNNWTLAEHRRGGANEAENDDIAWDAHWGASVVYDYWKQKHNRLSFDGNDAKIKSFIHSGVGYDNAFWNGSVMTYGDGSFPAPGGFKPLTSLDVCGHEIGHGVCSFTSDLVYAKESGAMNEGLSDIWAACAEYFAIRTVDPSLAALYKPFFIGEQISANPARPLRRMDSPKAESDPDTYGGQFWRNPDCSPSLANDQCGVHTNSGVLNKWFYLLTVGSGTGSGPDAAYAGEDDSVNDLGNRYSVTGVGFDLSEKITYLMELMLTSTATFAEAREVSIQIAASLSGSPCSALVKSVTDAWYAVGVGTAFQQPCTITYGFIFQPGGFSSEGQSGNGCQAETAVEIPVLLPANSTASITATGTATLGTDYRLSATSLSNTGSSPRQVIFTVFVRNDAVVETDETIRLSLTISNLAGNPANTVYTLTIVEDDVQPVIASGSRTLLQETFTRADGFDDPAGWSEILEVPEDPNGTQAAQGKNQWGIFGNRLAITGREELTGTQLPAGTYNTNSTSSTIARTPLIDARGLNTLQLAFDYRVQGEEDPSSTDPDTWPALDYMTIVYSFDGITWFEFAQPPFGRFASALPADGRFDNLLPSFLNNKQFYLGFRWVNDPLIGGPVSVAIDNLSLKGAARRMENDLTHNSRENLGNGADAYFYSIQDGEIIGRVKNSSGKDYGCTNLFVEKTGTGAFNLFQGKDGLHKVSDKVIRIETALIYKGANTITLYFTEDQLRGLESATGQPRTAFGIYHVSGIAYTTASAQNTRRYSAVYTPLPGVGGSYTLSHSERANGSYALGVVVSQPGLLTNRESIEMDQQPAWKFSAIHPNPGTDNTMMMVTSPGRQQLLIELVNSLGQVAATQRVAVQQGVNRVQLPTARVGSGAYLVRVRSEQGELLNSQSFIRK
jgi:Zn-dependent metalloprotease